LYDGKLFAAMKAAGVVDKILYGSDFPILSLGRYLKLMDSSGIDEASRKAILGENAMAFMEGSFDLADTSDA
jgi:hypothetical protein